MKNIFGVCLLLIGIGAIFIIPLLPLETNRAVKASFFSEQANQSIVYFGYIRCGKSCPITLSTLSQFYKLKKREKLQVIFVNLDPLEKKKVVRNYVSQFHPHFLGYRPERAELKNFQDIFGLNFRQTSESNIDHRGRVYFLKKEKNEWYLKASLNEFALTPQKIQKTLSQI